VVNVTVDQSTNLVVNPASLSIPANGAESFQVKLAKAPTGLVTVTVTPSPMSNLTTTPASLSFTLANFNKGETVLVSTGPGAVPGEQSVLLDAGPLGQFKLPVTITPASNTTFFINPDPMFGSDNNPGTAAKPWRFVENVLNSAKPTGLKVATVANAGNNVVVTILDETNATEAVTNNISTPALSAGSVTVLQAPFPKTFTLNLGGNKLILDKGYKLKDIQITSTATGTGTAVTINHPTAGLASVDVKCTGGVLLTCVEVAGAGSHILTDVRVDVTDATAGNIGILNNNASVSLSIVGGRVRPIGGASKAITLIESKGLLTVTGLTVDMTNDGHMENSKGIVLKAPGSLGSLVTGSTINVNDGVAPGNAIGIDVQAGPSTVEDNTFIGFGSNTIGVNGSANLSSSALFKNTFKGTFGVKVQ